MKTIEVPTIKHELKKVILEALRRSYTSASGHENIKTGNHYQSVTLGDERTQGFRSARASFLDRIDFKEKRVLDLGSNLGEMSRSARTRGAALVDGFEYDPFFIEIANAVNAYNSTTRVSFYEKDITDPKTFGEKYDIVLALSVYIYLQKVLGPLAEVTEGILVLETHRLDRNLETVYLDPISRHFPYHKILGASDWGSGLDPSGERAVIVFAKTEEALRTHVVGIRAGANPSSTRRRAGTRSDVRLVDARRTPWYDTFFARHRFKTPEELLAMVDQTEVDVDALVQSGDLATNGMGGSTYWLIYLKGALQHAAGQGEGPGNVYYELLLANNWDRDSARLPDYTDPDRLVALVQRRFRDFDLFRSDRDAIASIEPIRLIVREGPVAPTLTRGVKRLYPADSEIPVETTTVDGYHRLFVARLFGHSRIPCDFVPEADAECDVSA